MRHLAALRPDVSHLGGNFLFELIGCGLAVK